MSSPLDGRIRKLAREEAAAMAGVTPAPSADSVDPDRIAALETEVADLRGAMLRLDARLGAMEKDADPTTKQDARPAMRRTRKASE